MYVWTTKHTRHRIHLRDGAGVDMLNVFLLLRAENVSYNPSDTSHVAIKPDAYSESRVALTASDLLSLAAIDANDLMGQDADPLNCS